MELERPIEEYSTEELEKLLQEAKAFESYCEMQQNTVKRLRNSAYGALGNERFLFFNVNIAADITAEGRAIIQFCDATLNEFFRTWSSNEKVKELLGLQEVKNSERDIILYIDTDSLFINYGHVLKLNGIAVDIALIQKLHVEVVSPYLNERLVAYMAEKGKKCLFKFNLESISDAGLFKAKKKYLLRLSYKNGKFYGSNTKLLPKGIEIKQSSTPKTCKNMLIELLTNILDSDFDAYRKNLERLEKEFKNYPIEEICLNMSINSLGNESTFNSKAARLYNSIIDKYNLSSKYRKIKNGDKLKIYYTAAGEVFAFPEELPQEFAPEISYSMQFARLVKTPIEGIAELCGIHKKQVGMGSLLDFI